MSKGVYKGSEGDTKKNKRSLNPKLPNTVAFELIHAFRFVLNNRLSSIDNST